MSRKRRNGRPPLVSICIPSFNHARFLPAAIESVLAQTYPRVELVVVDDGSSDGSLEIAQRYAARYPGRMRVFVHDGHANRGISATANLAFEKSSGEYWCGLSSDDAFLADKVERQVAFLERYPDIGMLYGRATAIDANGRTLGETFVRDLSRERDPLTSLIQRNCLHGQTTMIRRECFETVGLHDETLMYSDWELWIRIAARFRVAFLPGPVAYYRVHPGNTSIGQPPHVQLERHLEVMHALERKAPLIEGRLARPFNRALIALQLAHLYFCAGDEAAADRSMTAAFEIDASVFSHVSFLAGWLFRRYGEMGSFTRASATDFLAWFVDRARSLPCGAGRRWQPRLAILLAEGAIDARRLRRAWRCPKLP